MSAHENLVEVLSKRFDDDARRAVLVLGAGMHHHLASKLPGRATEDGASAWRGFTDWNDLLSTVAKDFDLPCVRHEDPTATWEALVARATHLRAANARRASGATTVKAAYRVERELWSALRKRLKRLPVEPHALQPFGKAIAGSFRDVVTYNFDQTVETALASAGATVTPHLTPARGDADRLAHGFEWTLPHRSRLAGRVWHPHGHVEQSASALLGTRLYGRSISQLVKAFRRAKAAEKAWEQERATKMSQTQRERWIAARRGPEPWEPAVSRDDRRQSLTWMDLFTNSDLVFVGLGFDRAEFDLWWALHQRARNLAKVPPSRRPRTLVLLTDVKPHLATGPAGIVPVRFDSWDEAWSAVLGRWWESG